MNSKNCATKKISILTFSKGDNYGAVLQSYGLAEVLRRMGYNVEFIYLTWSTCFHRILSNITPLKYRFEGFRKKYLKQFSLECHSAADLSKAVKKSDLCIVGSDQVWNPDITTIRAKHYFFDFVPETIPVISYAASFGVDNWKWNDLKADVSQLLKRFSAISVREDSGIRILADDFGICAKKVLDPTLLLGDFSSLLLNNSEKDDNYVLGFKFVTSPEYYDFIRFVAGELDCVGAIMDMFPRDIKLTSGLKRKYFLSPQQWITNIANARFVITDSFHTLAFSLIFKRNFAIIPSSKLAKLQGRMVSLLKELGLEYRIFSSIEEARRSNVWNISIDYDEIDKKLNELRIESMEYLEKSLSTLI